MFAHVFFADIGAKKASLLFWMSEARETHRQQAREETPAATRMRLGKPHDNTGMNYAA